MILLGILLEGRRMRRPSNPVGCASGRAVEQTALFDVNQQVNSVPLMSAFPAPDNAPGSGFTEVGAIIEQ